MADGANTLNDDKANISLLLTKLKRNVEYCGTWEEITTRIESFLEKLNGVNENEWTSLDDCSRTAVFSALSILSAGIETILEEKEADKKSMILACQVAEESFKKISHINIEQNREYGQSRIDCPLDEIAEAKLKASQLCDTAQSAQDEISKTMQHFGEEAKKIELIINEIQTKNEEYKEIVQIALSARMLNSAAIIYKGQSRNYSILAIICIFLATAVLAAVSNYLLTDMKKPEEIGMAVFRESRMFLQDTMDMKLTSESSGKNGKAMLSVVEILLGKTFTYLLANRVALILVSLVISAALYKIAHFFLKLQALYTHRSILANSYKDIIAVADDEDTKKVILLTTALALADFSIQAGGDGGSRFTEMVGSVVEKIAKKQKDDQA